MTEEHEDRHPDDAEAERLLAHISEALRVPEGETYGQRSERQERLRNLQRKLAGLYVPLEGVDYHGDGRPEPLVLDLPLVPTPPPWRTSYGSAHGAAAERADRAEADAIMARVIEDAHATLDANKRAEGPRLVALQVLDHHLVMGLALPPRALELVGRALRIDPDTITAALRRARIRDGKEGTEVLADEWSISRQAVQQLRDKPYYPPRKLVLFLDLHHSTERSQPPRRSTRDGIARLLSQHGKPGRWPDEGSKAVRAEAQRRVDGKSANNADAVAEAVDADPRTVQRWMVRRGWEMAVLSEAVWLRGGLRPDANQIIDYDHDEGRLRLMTRAESNASRLARKHRAGR